jgi:hypothetical protein
MTQQGDGAEESCFQEWYCNGGYKFRGLGYILPHQYLMCKSEILPCFDGGNIGKVRDSGGSGDCTATPPVPWGCVGLLCVINYLLPK